MISFHAMQRRRRLRIGPVAAALLLTALSFITLLVVGAAPASAKQYDITAYAIDLELTDAGDYVITERITYNFIDGTFTRANRSVPGRGFDALRFIEVTGVDHPVNSVSFTDGRNLNVEWTYPETDGQATFEIKYEAVGGLRSKDGLNVIDWNPVGSDWTVPLRNIDVTVTLPQSVGNISALPPEDVVGTPTSQRVQFHRDALPPRTFYHVVVNFPEIIPIVTLPKPPAAPWVGLGLLLGALLLVLDIRSHLANKPEPAATGPGAADLSLLEMSVLTSTAEHQRRRGIAATVFALAQAGVIRLTVEPKRNAFSTDKVHVDVVNAAEVGSAQAGSKETGSAEGKVAGPQRAGAGGEAERFILDELQRHKTLRKFAQQSSVLRKIVRTTEQRLIQRGLISRDRQRKQGRDGLLGLLLGLLGGVGFVVYGFHPEHPVLLVPAVVLVLLAVGRFVRAAGTALTPEGLHARDSVRALLDAKMERIDDLMRYEMEDAWDALFAELPYLVLHDKFHATKISRLQRQFRRMDRVSPPDWIGYDVSNVGKAMDAFTAAELVNYTFVAVIATAQSSGASGVGGAGAGGVGAAGSGAGGGGGGAG